MNSSGMMTVLQVALGAVLLLLVLTVIVRLLCGFSRELRYINSEIERSTGRERRQWIRRRRRLWLSLLPFFPY